MREEYGNLWDFPADYKCITTNGTVKRNGEAVMGKGCALEAAQLWPDVPSTLGAFLKTYGNHVGPLRPRLLSFPVKHHWRGKANIDLIRQSAEELITFLDDVERVRETPPTAVLPRPGCGNGGLNWPDVQLVIEPILDDRVTVITFAPR